MKPQFRVYQITREMHGEQIKFYAVSCAANKPICQDFKVKGFPQLRLFRQGSNRVAAKMKYYSLHPYAIPSIHTKFVQSTFYLNDFVSTISWV